MLIFFERIQKKATKLVKNQKKQLKTRKLAKNGQKWPKKLLLLQKIVFFQNLAIFISQNSWNVDFY